jgi:hypothetical protein
VKAEMDLAPCTTRHHSSAQLRAILEPKQINFARGYDSIATRNSKRNKKTIKNK